MNSKSTDLISLFERSLKGFSKEKLQESGIVISVGDGICRVHGLENALYGEKISFESGNAGIIFDLGQDVVAIFLLYDLLPVSEGELAKRTGASLKVPVGNNMIGRVVNALGEPIDALGEITSTTLESIEQPIPPIIDRSPIDESLETGIISIDALIPIGRGQRELIIGNRDTGKTTVAIDTILHQKGGNVLCVYVSIGQRQANLARVVRILEDNGALAYTTIVSANAGEVVLNQYLSPYVGCTIAEYFRKEGRDVLIVYDDLSNHAVAFREMSLLLRRSPGREAYPGDIFYLHSRLLERAGKLLRGGSMTALPIIQIQSDDITAYIPTNLISITDGQIFLDTKLFNKGIQPAVNIELSVSRVGGAAQTKAIKKVTRALRLELAQYRDLLDFAQFGTELDEISQKRLRRGERIIEILKQPKFVTYSFVDQALMLFLIKDNFLDDVEVTHVRQFATQYVSYVKSVYHELYEGIRTSQNITDEMFKRLAIAAREFRSLFTAEDT